MVLVENYCEIYLLAFSRENELLNEFILILEKEWIMLRSCALCCNIG